MSNQSENNRRIAKNTILLYVRMMLMMAVSLYTSRVVLSTLGVEDYGVYNVVGGFVAMLGFFNAALSSGTQRYITFYLGQKDRVALSKVFATCMLAHIFLAGLIFLLADTIGLWFVLNKLTLPAERMTAALWVYQCSIMSSIVMILSVPYNANIVAHEKMSAFAYISLIEAFLKLGIVFLLPVIDYDRMIVYALLQFSIQILIRFIYTNYCHRNFPESHFRFILDKKLFKEVLSFSSWNLFGSMANALSTQGVNIVLNIFFGPVVNAARGIAVQVQGAVHMFAGNFQMALNPQITKSYATGDLSRMHDLVFKSSKFSFYLLICLSAPICVGINMILSIWLKEQPAYTNVFVVLMLIITILEAMANPMVVSAAATGRIKLYQFVVGTLMMCIVPLSYLFLWAGGDAYIVFVAHILVALLAFWVRLYILRPMIKLSLYSYFKQVVIPCGLVGIVLLAIIVPLFLFLTNNAFQTVASMIFSFIASVGVICVIGLTKGERTFVLEKVKTIKNRI